MEEMCVVSNSLYVSLSLFSIVSASRSWIYMVSEVVVLAPEIQKKNHFSAERKYGKNPFVANTSGRNICYFFFHLFFRHLAKDEFIQQVGLCNCVGN